MARNRRPFAWQSLAWLTLGSAWACNAVLGIDEGHIEARNECVLNSDCAADGNVCLFRVCSPPCKEDQDCNAGSRCLTTDNGTACAAQIATSCASDDDCEGATCAGGMCRASCGQSSDCLTGQTCVDRLCYGTDPNHDTIAGGGSGGSGNVNVGPGGAGGALGTPGGAPGEGGAGGMPGPTRECETSATRCNEQGQRETCSADGTWGSAVDCPFACVVDDCGGECVPDDKDCLLGVTPRECDAQGEWDAMPDCPAVCVDGACQASCQTDVRQCSGKDVMLCSAQGKFEKEKTCEFLCDETTQQCVGECNPTSQRCDDDKLQTCDANATWQTLATCPALCTPKAGMPGQFECSGDCKPTHKQCDGASTLQTCNAQGQYDDTNCAATNKTCVEAGNSASCTGICAPGQKRCSSNKVQACNGSGAYADSQSCVNQTCVQSGSSASCTGSCAPMQQECLNNRVRTCNASGDYADSDNCTTSNETCTETGSTAACGGNCSPGQTTCTNNDAYQCNDGVLTLADNCAPPGEICNAGACIPNDPYTIGHASSATFANLDVPDNTWYVVKVVAPSNATVIALRLLGRSATGTMRMGLWENNAGAPGAFMAQTDNTTMANGVVSDAPVPLDTKVEAGKTYWVGAKFTGGAQIYQKSVAGESGYTLSQSFGTNPATMNPFPSAGTFSNVQLNFYLLVQDESL